MFSKAVGQAIAPSVAIALSLAAFVVTSAAVAADAPAEKSPRFASLSADVLKAVLTADEVAATSRQIDRDLQQRSDAANARNRAEWAKVDSKAGWEAFRDERIARLRAALADFPTAPAPLVVHSSGVIRGERFRIEKLVYESRPGVWVPAHLYCPDPPRDSMPALMIAHSHHRDKPQSELQDMGMTWARAGCLVLVIDQTGHGERRAHPFHRAEDFPKPFQVSRQDYRFRYDSGVQLHLLGDSLMGWMAWDWMRAVDLLLDRPGIDPRRIAILGAVAGGGDPAGVAAALDPRIAACAPFNFGGPQPESRFPLPDDAETRFNLLGGAYWESTRGLRLGGRDDFFPWVIVASTAPRPLIHAHEFAWDEARDPAWSRYRKIWGDFYGAADKLAAAHGKGTLKQQPPEASHCTNIGRFHRRMIHPAFARWFDIRVEEADEYSQPLDSAQLVCWTPELRRQLGPLSFNEALRSLGNERVARLTASLATKRLPEQRQMLRDAWTKRLGAQPPATPPRVVASATDPAANPATNPAAKPATMAPRVERTVLEVEPGIVVPVMILTAAKRAPDQPGRAVVAIAESGKAAFLSERGAAIQELLGRGFLVALPDLRGIGETGWRGSRGREAATTDRSASLQLYGESFVGQRLRDLRAVLTHLRARRDVSPTKIGLWAESFAEPNAADAAFSVPHGVDGWPRFAEPGCGLVALLAAVFDERLAAVQVTGGLVAYRAVLEHHAVLVPHDAIVPGMLPAGDLRDLAAAIAPRPLRIAAAVDHLNRVASAEALKSEYERAASVYQSAGAASAFELSTERAAVARWLDEQIH
jgi:dienelactone hydrolase